MSKIGFLKKFSSRDLLFMKFAAAFVLLALFMGVSYNYISSRKAVLRARQREFAEFSRLMKKYETGRAALRPLKMRLVRRGQASSPVTVLEEIGSDLGIKDKISSFKAVEESVRDGYEIRGVEVSVKGLTLNEFVNLVYEVERYPGLLLVKELELETGFEDNKLMDCSMTVLLVGKAKA